VTTPSKAAQVTSLKPLRKRRSVLARMTTVRLDIDEETLAHFGADTKKMAEVLRCHMEEQEIKAAYEKMKKSRKKSK